MVNNKIVNRIMSENQSTEQKIIEAAKQVFIEKGLELAKMSDIAERAEISRTALNYYYRTKENLFYAIIEQVFDSLLPQIESLSAMPGNLSDKIGGVVDIYNNILRQNEYLPRFVFVELQRNPHIIYDFVEKSTKAQLYLQTIGILIGDKMFTNNDLKHSKMHLLTIFFGLVFVPYLLEPLLGLYREPDENLKTEFLDEHKELSKKILRNYFEINK
jgi:AcrR family transcriptional regulator